MLARHGRLHQGSLARISWSTWTGFARIARDISPALSGFEPHCEPGLLELLGGGIHDGEIHAADPVRCRRGLARRRLGGGVGWPVDAIVIEAGAFGGVPPPPPASRSTCCRATAASEAFCMPTLCRSGHRQQPGYPVGMAPRFPRFRRAYVTVPEYGRAVVDVSGSAARLAAPVARPRAATIRRGGIRLRPRRGCCGPRGSSVG
jgi:hypothetical protein